jgi:hypothetical protein
VLTLCARGARLPYPQPECRSYYPKITATVLVRVFRTLLDSSSRYNAKGRLRRCFPGPVIAVGQDKIVDPSLREVLAQFLATLDVSTLKEAWPVVIKAHSQTPEIRDSIHPKFITEMLTGILRGIGQPVNAARIHKRTRDDVLWNNVPKPWRRSPLWLLLRVALQTSLGTEADDRHKR